MRFLQACLIPFAKTVKDDKQKRPLWMKRHEPKLGGTGERGGHKNLDQLLKADPTVEEEKDEK